MKVDNRAIYKQTKRLKMYIDGGRPSMGLPPKQLRNPGKVGKSGFLTIQKKLTLAVSFLFFMLL